jgi:hypothetical protein|tara:strand:+ start:7034 stop:7366 length:333 start_codon:yes stop_codon:yes gene_type:complete
MTATIEREESMSGFEEQNILPEKYSCQILQEKTTLAAANDKTLPTDARLIFYNVNGVDYIDLVRCRKTVELFDMYYDAYGPGSVKKIDFGYGQVNPKLWGYQSKNKEKKK